MAVQPAELAADAAPFPDRDAAITDAGVNHPGQDQLRPAVAARALGSEVIVLESIRRGEFLRHFLAISLRHRHRFSPGCGAFGGAVLRWVIGRRPGLHSGFGLPHFTTASRQQRSYGGVVDPFRSLR